MKSKTITAFLSLMVTIASFGLGTSALGSWTCSFTCVQTWCGEGNPGPLFEALTGGGPTKDRAFASGNEQCDIRAQRNGCTSHDLELSNPGCYEQQAPTKINVHFRNLTGRLVVFHLNGGGGLWTNLDRNSQNSYSVVVDSGVQPLISIRQPDGSLLKFTIANTGRYDFKMNNGRIENFYRP
jgi:hypothetical protein